MTDTNLEQRNFNDCLDKTADLVRQARQRAEQAEWTGHPNAMRLRDEANMLEQRWKSGELYTPKF